ncbi:concanavalin A-like lectin/glucanase domain-containing protein [Xylaria flabelliformis]|nr:concanavalin A-like lectin/glucanase domain-containing protein [Xylaria flabelliformis]
MATSEDVPKRQITPVPAPVLPVSVLPQKRVLEDDHAPSIPSPLNPNQNPTPNPQFHDDQATMARDKPTRTKKETLKKRESKVGAGAGVGIGGGGGGGIDSSRATPDPKTKEPAPSESSPLRYKLAPPKPADFDPARAPIFTHHHEALAPDGSLIQFYETSEHVYNKKNYHYLHCIADPVFPSSFYYRQTEPEPYGAHMSYEDASTHMYFDQSGRHVTTDKGFRMVRANVAVREGTWYWECKITRGILNRNTATNSKDAAYQPEAHGHVRIGFARREASLDAPVGFDAYSYGFRDVAGQKVHMSRPKDFFPPGEDMKEGDVIGLEIRLPSEHLHRKIVQGQYNPAVDLNEEEEHVEAANIVRDRIPIRFKAHIYFEKIDYHTTKELEDLMNPSPVGASGHAGTRQGDKPNPNHAVPALRTLPNSYIKVYKNGVLMGTAFTDLFAFLPPASKPQVQVGAREGKDDGMLGYYPAISVFRGGAVEANFGPDFWFPPPGYASSPSPQTDADAMDVDDEDTVRVGTPQQQQKLDKTRAIADRYDEQIVEDVVADIVDEVDFWMQDGARVLDRTGGRDEKAEPVGIAPASEEIKELVQDD